MLLISQLADMSFCSLTFGNGYKKSQYAFNLVGTYNYFTIYKEIKYIFSVIKKKKQTTL